MESEERRKKKKIAATESVRTSTGTVITIPFCCVGDVTRAIRFRFFCSLAECREELSLQLLVWQNDGAGWI